MPNGPNGHFFWCRARHDTLHCVHTGPTAVNVPCWSGPAPPRPLFSPLVWPCAWAMLVRSCYSGTMARCPTRPTSHVTTPVQHWPRPCLLFLLGWPCTYLPCLSRGQVCLAASAPSTSAVASLCFHHADRPPTMASSSSMQPCPSSPTLASSSSLSPLSGIVSCRAPTHRARVRTQARHGF